MSQIEFWINIVGVKKNWESTKCLEQKKIWDQKTFGVKIFWSKKKGKKDLGKNYFVSKKRLDQLISWSIKFLGHKKFCAIKNKRDS